ncbi:hypothetical protein M408DRAFT_332522 [Serendipita vermifera MAFF 305830]|uniref:CFEM domain-containing protein n=1 Tax=Serendipita vermifera MAFF 305830 TaxID=933852 RepID=A0A0C2WRF8_SERVB|nr:hypothetical protein M408DRAFT_334104 [Serendipita vermifera MAFF 305830]KIM23041.1 hypothetical protein M408DRAFT_332522 [Serendipita vermifera MAFF 305830]
MHKRLEFRSFSSISLSQAHLLRMYSPRLTYLIWMLSAFTLVLASPAKRQFATCGQNCILPGPPLNVHFGTCSSSDFNCLCTSQSFVQAAINCFSSRCSGSDLSTINAQFELRCLQAGVPTLSSVTTPGVTLTGTRTVIDVPSNTPTGVTTATSSAPSSSTLENSSSSLRYSSIQSAIGALIFGGLLLA